MRLPQLQPVRLAAPLLAILVAMSLGGCLARSLPTTTSSIAGSATALRERADALGRKYEQSPADAATAIDYARLLRAQGQNAQAVAVLQQTAILVPKDMSVLAAYGKALADVGRLKEAADVLSRSHNPERPDWQILSVQGAVADQAGDHVGAQRFYEASLRIAPGEPSTLSNQGLSFALINRLAEAESILRVAAAHPRADGRVQQNLAMVLRLQGKSEGGAERSPRDLPRAPIVRPPEAANPASRPARPRFARRPAPQAKLTFSPRPSETGRPPPAQPLERTLPSPAAIGLRS